MAWCLVKHRDDFYCVVGLTAAGWSGVRVPPGVGNFSLHHHFQTGSEAHPAFYPGDTRGSFPGVKAAGGVNSWSYTSTPPYVFVTWYLVKHRNDFTFRSPTLLSVGILFHVSWPTYLCVVTSSDSRMSPVFIKSPISTASLFLFLLLTLFCFYFPMAMPHCRISLLWSLFCIT
jgi:hypothetical protein